MPPIPSNAVVAPSPARAPARSLTTSAALSASPLASRRAATSLLVFALGLPSLPASAQQNVASGVDVGLRDGLLTIRANATPADQLAVALQDATGIAIVVTGEPSTPLSADIVDEPIAKAIGQLAPNHLVVRESAAADAPIVEVVLMMPDGQGGDSSAEFLPSGAPADNVDGFAGDQMIDGDVGFIDGSQLPLDENGQPIDPNALRDPNRLDAVRDAANAAAEAAAAIGFDPNTGLPIDDGSGAYQEPIIDPATGEIIPQQ